MATTAMYLGFQNNPCHDNVCFVLASKHNDLCCQSEKSLSFSLRGDFFRCKIKQPEILDLNWNKPFTW